MEITYQDVIEWIIENDHNTEAMDKINRLSYIHTNKFKQKNLDRDENGGRQADDQSLTF